MYAKQENHHVVSSHICLQTQQKTHEMAKFGDVLVRLTVSRGAFQPSIRRVEPTPASISSSIRYDVFVPEKHQSTGHAR